MLFPLQAEFLKRIRAAVCFADSIRESDRWIIESTSDPKKKDQPFSFHEHEYQIAICRDNSPEQVIVKPSQVGASELSVRRALGFAAILQGAIVIYTLPTFGFSANFCKERFDPTIANSKVLRAMINPDVDNTKLKQLGDSFLHISGTFGDVSAISVPAQVLIKDEVNFSNQTVLGKFSSRLRHNKEGDAIDIEFSTPTDPGFGVSEKFDKSDRKYYHVLHDNCGEWVWLHPETCVVLPGFNDDETMRSLKLDTARSILDIEEDTLDNVEIDVDGAWYRCPFCKEEVTHANLSSPEKRQWFATRQSNISGWQVFPYDVPAYNKLPSLLRQITKYEKKSDWVNFCWGLPYSDTSTKFNTAQMVIGGNSTEPVEGCATGTIAGLDIGKSSWYTVGKPEGKGVRIIYAEKIVNSNDGAYLKERTLLLNKWFGVEILVIDTAPDISAFRGIKAESEEGAVYGCQYIKQMSRKAENFELDQATEVISAHRTGTLNSTCTEFNKGIITFTNLALIDTVKEHLDNLQRVTLYNDTGEQVHKWISNRKPDHFAHSLNYLRIAWKLLDADVSTDVVPSIPMLQVANLKERVTTRLQS